VGNKSKAVLVDESRVVQSDESYRGVESMEWGRLGAQGWPVVVGGRDA
jgi:hypothetical protein